MKRVGRFCLRIFSIAVIVSLVIVLLPSISSLVSRLLPKGDPTVCSVLLKREMAKVGKLATVEYTDTGVLSASTSALFLGDVQKVTAPYTYQIALGIDLDQANLSVANGKVTVSVPELSMLYDKLTVTDDPAVEDFWYPLTEAQYQRMLDTEEENRRNAYLQDAEMMENAWAATVEKLEALLSRWLQGGSWQISVERQQ